MDRRRGVILNHDAYDPAEEKGETPEALAAFFPLTYRTDPEIERATTAYYLKLAPKYVGSPMLSPLLGVYAARLGDRERAAELFERGYAQFILEPFHQTAEYHPDVFPEQPQAAPMFANIGGFLMSCLYGLPGLRLGPGDPQSWCERPVVMPAGWDGVEVERIWVRGQPARLVARHGDEHAHIEMLPDG
jgi:protein-glucosylgalactosylhydroxylysine glucosidase